MTEAELNAWKKKIVAGTADYSELDPPTYKYLDKYNALMMAYKYGEKTKEECQRESVMLSKEYDNDNRVYEMYGKAYKEYQNKIKLQDEYITNILTTSELTMEEVFQILLAYVALERGEDITSKAILKRYGMDKSDTWHALTEART